MTNDRPWGRRCGVAALLACAATLTSAPGWAAEPSAKADADPMQFARGAKSWSANCERCHNMRDPHELRDDQWRVVMTHMRVRADLTGKETRDILAFLQASN